MNHGKVDRFMNELIRLAAVLGYSGEFVKYWARMGMSDVLNAAWSMKTPHPVAYIDYLDLLRQTGHQLEDASNFHTQVQKEPHPSRRAKSHDRHTTERRDRGRKTRPQAHGRRSPATERKGLQNPQKKSIRRCPRMCLRL